ncbi:hypothetical protein OC842_007711, partial [Tilletia horrida]
MPSFSQEFELFELFGDVLCSQASGDVINDRVDSIQLPPAVASSWKRFLDQSAVAVTKKNPYPWQVMPALEQDQTKKAMNDFKKDPQWPEYRKLLKELTTFSQSQASQEMAAPRPQLQIPGQSSQGASRLQVPGISSSTGEAPSGPRRSGRTVSPSSRLRGYAVARGSSDRHRRANSNASSDDQGLSGGESGDRRYETPDDDSDEDVYRPPSNAQRRRGDTGKRFASARDDAEEEDKDDEDDEDDEEEVDRVTARGRATKRFRATDKEAGHFQQARGRQSASTKQSRTLPRQPTRMNGQSSATAIDLELLADEPDKSFDVEEDTDNRGKGAEEIRQLRDDMKARLPKLQGNEPREWRMSVINKLSSKYILYYYDLLKRYQDRDGKVHYTWKCRCCKNLFHPQAGQNSNLISHVKGTQTRGSCNDRFKPQTPGVMPFDEFEPSAKETAQAPEAPVPKSFTGEHARMAKWRTQVSDATRSKQAQVLRRSILIWIVMTSQPFTAPTNPYFAAMLHAANPAAAFDSIRSPRTIGRDLDFLYKSLYSQAITSIQAAPGKFTIQHDVWTTPSGRDAFLAVHASWIDNHFRPRTACIGFDRLGMDHTGAVLAGHLAGFLDASELWGKWSGLVVCDAAESNVRAARFIGQEIQKPNHNIPDDVKAQKHLEDFSILDNVILCFAHGLNRAVVDGAKAAGAHVTMVDKTQDKVVRPTIMIDATAAGGDIQAWEEMQAGMVGEKVDAAMIKEVQEQYQEIDDDVAAVFDDPEPADTSPSQGQPAGGEDREIVQDYATDDNIESASSAPDRLHKCLVKIRASTKAIAHFQEMLINAYPEPIKRPTLPSLRNDTRWNSFLRELRGCVKAQKAFIQLFNSDETDTWTPFKLTAAEWKAMDRLCTALECAETITMDVQRVQCSVAEVLLFHFILKSSIRFQLSQLGSLSENDPAYGVVLAMKAIQTKIEKYRSKAVLNNTIVVATALHPAARDWLPKRYPEIKDVQTLMREYANRYVGKKAGEARPLARSKKIDDRYLKYLDIDGLDADPEENDPISDAEQVQPNDEVDLYFSDRYVWDDTTDGPTSTEQALKWWKRHRDVLPRL